MLGNSMETAKARTPETAETKATSGVPTTAGKPHSREACKKMRTSRN
jgi:hypothetical protein